MVDTEKNFTWALYSCMYVCKHMIIGMIDILCLPVSCLCVRHDTVGNMICTLDIFMHICTIHLDQGWISAPFCMTLVILCNCIFGPRYYPQPKSIMGTQLTCIMIYAQMIHSLFNVWRSSDWFAPEWNNAVVLVI